MTWAVVCLTGGGLAASVVAGAPGSGPAEREGDAESAYSAMIGKRADDIVAALGLGDPAAAERVRHVLVGRYRELRAWHDAHDRELESLGWKPDAET